MKKKIYLFKTLILTSALFLGLGYAYAADPIKVEVDDGSSPMPSHTYTSFEDAIDDVNLIGSSGYFSGVSSSSPVTVTIPEGTFDEHLAFLPITLNKNDVTIVGQGAGKSVITVGTGGNQLFEIAANNVTIKGLTFDVVGDYVAIVFASNVIIEDVTIKNPGANALVIDRSQVEISGLTVAGAASSAPIGLINGSNTVTIDSFDNIETASNGAILSDGGSTTNTLTLPEDLVLIASNIYAKPDKAVYKIEKNTPTEVKLEATGGDVEFFVGDITAPATPPVAPSIISYMVIVKYPDGKVAASGYQRDTIADGASLVTQPVNSGGNASDSISYTFPAHVNVKAGIYEVIIVAVRNSAPNTALAYKTVKVVVGEPLYPTADMFENYSLKDVRYDGELHTVDTDLSSQFKVKDAYKDLIGDYVVLYQFGDDDPKPAATRGSADYPFPSELGVYTVIIRVKDSGSAIYNGTDIILGTLKIYNENDYQPNYGHQVAVFSNPGLTFEAIGAQPLPGVFTWGISEPLSITVTPNTGYSVDNIAITDDGKPLTATVTKNADGSLTFVIATVSKNLSIKFTGVETVEAAEAVAATTVYGAAGAIYVSAPTASVVDVYSITGALAKTATVSGTATITLPAGIYIVKVGTTITKVIVK